MCNVVMVVRWSRKSTGLKGFEPLTYRCPSDARQRNTWAGGTDKSRSLYLAKLQARGRAYWPP
jgi:hypothetical protein